MNKTPSKRPKPAREALIQAARLEFAEQGYVGATTREIARRAGTNEVMLFRHFQSKSNLFMEAVFRPLDENMMEFIANQLQSSPPGIMSAGDFKNYSGNLFDFLSSNRSLFVALISASASEKSNTLGVNDLTSLESYFTHAAEALTFSMSESDRDLLGNPAIVVRMTFSLVAALALFKDWLFPEPNVPFEEAFDVMTRFVERGLGITLAAPDSHSENGIR